MSLLVAFAVSASHLNAMNVLDVCTEPSGVVHFALKEDAGHLRHRVLTPI